jgi:glycosyltransferase involved in cell wall biosynthesis
MKISVLIPTYNSAPYLAECLESVLAQDFDGLEILVSDDCSQDDTPKIIASFATRDARIRWWRNSQNLGLLANHNLLLREARGNYVKVVHHDDKLLSPLCLAKMAAVLDQNPGVALVASACELMDSNSRCRRDEPREYLSAGVYAGSGMIKLSFEFEVAANYIGAPSLVMFRRSFAQRGFAIGFCQSLDSEMWLHLLEQGKFVYLTESLCAFRQHFKQQSAVNARARDGRNEIELLMLLESYWAKHGAGGVVSQRMLAASIRFLKKKRAKFDSHIGQADKLLGEMNAKTNPLSRAFFWLEHKMLRSSKRIQSLAIRQALQKCKAD